MKKTGRILTLILLCIIGISVGNNRHIFAKSKKIGSFQFIYKIDANSKVRIQKVKICNAKRITKLVIPSKLDGKPDYVVSKKNLLGQIICLGYTLMMRIVTLCRKRLLNRLRK